jgi:hypothetical protein
MILHYGEPGARVPKSCSQRPDIRLDIQDAAFPPGAILVKLEVEVMRLST